MVYKWVITLMDGDALAEGNETQAIPIATVMFTARNARSNTCCAPPHHQNLPPAPPSLRGPTCPGMNSCHMPAPLSALPPSTAAATASSTAV